MASAKELIAYLARGLVDAPESVAVHASGAEGTGTLLELQVAADDRGKVIGKKGRVAHTMRTLLRAAKLDDEAPVSLEIVD